MLRCITVENLFPQKFFPLAQKVKWHSVYMGFSRPKPAALLVHAQRLFNVCLLIDYCKPCAQTTQQSHFLLSDRLFCLSKFSPLLSSLFISKGFLVPKRVCGVWWDFQVALHQHCCPQVCAEHIKPSYNSQGGNKIICMWMALSACLFQQPWENSQKTDKLFLNARQESS